ncbi:LPS export ABC transporter periplasmic protein LptC [Dialister sp.]|uniref:LPS export ABC transporter periplasmic protein LptC n=1 Tax=Dialister sp. TaxID=1955814 RepID=UPI003F0ECEAA
MKKNRNLILIVVLILLAAGGIYFLFKDDNRGMNAASSSSSSMEFHNTDMKESKDGKIVWRFKAGHVAVSQDQNLVTMEKVEGFFMKDDKELHLTADRGRIDRKAKTVYIEGNVQGNTKDGEELYAENLTYDGNKEILSTDKAFVVKKDGKVLTADRFEADRILQEITARGHAKLAEEEGKK